MAADLVLITGVSGYIGFRTLLAALAAGHRIRAVVRKEEQIQKLQQHPLAAPYTDRVEWAIVPDMAKRGAFDHVLDGVTAIVHLASPLAVDTTDYETDIVKPAISVTTSVLESANAAPAIKRVVVTSSAVTLMPIEWLSANDSKTVFTEKDINSNPTRSFHSSMEAYWASKAWSRIASHDFIASHKPHFELVNILPTVVIGPDALATSTGELLKGTRAMVMSPVLGQKQSFPCVGTPVHVDDVARAHVDALKPNVPGNADYILASETPDGVEWDSASEIAIRLFPEAVEKGILPLGGTLPSQDFKIDDGATKKAFGWECQSYEKTMEGLIGQYIELKAKEE